MHVVVYPRRLYFSGKISEFRRWLSWYAWESASLAGMGQNIRDTPKSTRKTPGTKDKRPLNFQE